MMVGYRLLERSQPASCRLERATLPAESTLTEKLHLRFLLRVFKPDADT